MAGKEKPKPRRPKRTKKIILPPPAKELTEEESKKLDELLRRYIANHGMPF